MPSFFSLENFKRLCNDNDASDCTLSISCNHGMTLQTNDKSLFHIENPLPNTGTTNYEPKEPAVFQRTSDKSSGTFVANKRINHKDKSTSNFLGGMFVLLLCFENEN